MLDTSLRCLHENQIHCDCAYELIIGIILGVQEKEKFWDVSKLQHVTCEIHAILAWVVINWDSWGRDGFDLTHRGHNKS